MLKLESAKAKLPFSNVPRYGPEGVKVLAVGEGLGRAGPVVRVGEGLGVGEALTVGDGETVGRGEDVVVGDGVGVGEAVGDEVGLGELDAVGVGVGVARGITDGDPSPGHVCESRIPESEFKIVA